MLHQAKKLLLLFIFPAIFSQADAQNFIAKAEIEYEVKTNLKKTIGTGFWAEMIQEKLPDIKTGYYKFIYNNNKSIFKFDRWAPNNIPAFLKQADEETIWYSDFEKGEISVKKNIIGSNFFVQDSLRKISWKLTNENMIIAGFNCRKAEAVIFDSVYIFAYFSEELMIPGGPASINGLPGLILGLTIPRLYTSYVATKIMVNDVSINEIKAPTAKKTFTYEGLKNDYINRTQNWNESDDEEENRKSKQMTLWNIQL